MKSIASDFSEMNFSEIDEKKSLFECKSYENIHPNDVVGWYEKIYRGFDHFQSEMYINFNYAFFISANFLSYN